MTEPVKEEMESLPVKSRLPGPWIVPVLTLVMAGVVLAWNAQVRYREFAAYQQQLMESSVHGTAAQLEIFLGELQRSVHLFAYMERERIRQLAANPDDEKLLAGLDAAMRGQFSGVFAFTLAGREGAPLLTDFDGLMGEVCLRDMRIFATDRQHSKVYMHPHPSTYHFDIMVDLEGDGEQAAIFFASFKTDILSRILRHGQLPGHRLMLLKQDIPRLIEMSADGPRIVLLREFKLSMDEMSRIGHSTAVGGTSWDLVDLPEAKLYADMRAGIWRETALVMLAIVAVTAIMMGLFQHAQARRREIEYAYAHDAATGLPARHHFMERLERRVAAGLEDQSGFTLMLIDPGRFRRLKGTFFEHRVDDTLMRWLARRIEQVLAGAEIVARIGENDYAALLPGHDTGQIEAVSYKVLAALRQPLGAQGDIILSDPCTGYARFPEDGGDAYALVRHAGTQVYIARQRGGQGPAEQAARENVSRPGQPDDAH